MIEIKRISTADAELYKYMEQLLIASFPEEEYRNLGELRTYTDTIPDFHCNIILDDGTPAGFVSYWDLGDFCYIEHFAIDPEKRNGGYGGKLLDQLRAKEERPFVLEVELPEEEMAQRRINFYQRKGYTLWEEEYFQPPYKAGDGQLPMLLMVNGALNPRTDFERIKGRIHRTVYGVKG